MWYFTFIVFDCIFHYIHILIALLSGDSHYDRRSVENMLSTPPRVRNLLLWYLWSFSPSWLLVPYTRRGAARLSCLSCIHNNSTSSGPRPAQIHLLDLTICVEMSCRKERMSVYGSISSESRLNRSSDMGHWGSVPLAWENRFEIKEVKPCLIMFHKSRTNSFEMFSKTISSRQSRRS